MGGKPCIRGLRVTVGTIIGLIASQYSPEDILRLYPYLEAEDIQEALAYAAWRVEEPERDQNPKFLCGHQHCRSAYPEWPVISQ